MPMNKLLAAGVAVAAAATLSACATLGHILFKRPTVSLASVRLTGLSTNAGGLDVALKVVNPNSYSLNGTKLHYQVSVDSTPLAEGALDQRFSVPGRDSAIIDIPVAFSFAALGAAGRALQSFGEVHYRVTGDVTVLTPIGGRDVPFQTDGRFSALDLLRR